MSGTTPEPGSNDCERSFFLRYHIPKKPQGCKRSSSGQPKAASSSDHGAGGCDPPPGLPKKESSYSRRGGREGGEVLVAPRRQGAANAEERLLRNEALNPVGGTATDDQDGLPHGIHGPVPSHRVCDVDQGSGKGEPPSRYGDGA